MRGRRTRQMGSLGTAILVTVVVVAGSAAAQSQPKLPTELPVPKTGPSPAAPGATPAPAAAPASPNTPEGARDPFDPPVRKAGPGEERGQEIAGLRLVGVVWDAKDPSQIRALVETSDGLGYYLRANEEKFGGTVAAIERDRIRFSVKEQVPGGQSRTRTVELRLNKPDGS